MDFRDSPEEARFRDEARAWLEANATRLGPGESNPGFEEGDDPAAIAEAQSWQARKAAAGWAGITWPVAYGGRGGTPIEAVIWHQEESRFRVPPDIFLLGIGLAGPTLMTHGSAAQQERWLPPMLRGEEIWCQLFSEPGAGSDLAGLRTRAERDGEDWIVTGQKIWTSGAHHSQWGILVARSDPDAVKHAGLTYFVVDMKSPGIEVRPIRQITGGANFNEVFLTDVRIPDANRISEVGNGWAVALTTLMNERVAADDVLGPALGVLDLIELTERVELEGRPAIEDSAVQQRIADFYVRSEGLRYTSYRTLTALSRGAIPGPEGSIGKLVSAPLNQEMASFAVELQGSSAALLDPSLTAFSGSWQEFFLWAPGMRIAGGTDDILRNIIAERVLRLPPDARADKDLPFRKIPTGGVD